MPVDLNRRMPYWPQGYWAGYWPVEYWPVKVIAATFAEPVIGGVLGGRGVAEAAGAGQMGRGMAEAAGAGQMGRGMAEAPQMGAW